MASIAALAVEKEIEKVADQLQGFDSIAEHIDRRRYKIHHIEDFRQLVLRCKQLLNRNLEERLRLAIEGLDSRDQIKELDRFRSMIRKLAERLNDIAVNSMEIPQELYFLCDNFLEYHNVSPRYIVSVSDEIALTPFSFILQNIKFDEEYFFKEFWNTISKENFYIIQVVSGLAETASSLDWTVILHEIAHMICSEKGIEDKYFPGTSIYDALMTILTVQKGIRSATDPGVPSAAKKLYASEFLADYLVTRCYGPTFGWRFVHKWIDLRHVFEVSRTLETHPEPKRRLGAIINEVRVNLKMPEIAKFLEKESATLSGLSAMREEKDKSSSINVDNLIKDVEKAIAPIRKKACKYSTFILTKESIQKSISRSIWFRMKKRQKGAQKQLASSGFENLLKKLRSDISKGKPVVVDPPVIYYLVTLNVISSPKALEKIEGKTEDAKMFREFIADLARLYHIKSQFIQIKRTKQSLKKKLAKLQ